MTIQPRDVRIGIAVETDAGQVSEMILRRTNLEVCDWEIYAARNKIPVTAHTLALTYQAWRTLKNAGEIGESFETWRRRVIEVWPCVDDGRRLTTNEDGELVTVDGDQLDPDGEAFPDPTK